VNNGLPLAFSVVAGLVAATIMRSRGSLAAPPLEVSYERLSLYRWNQERNRFDLVGTLPRREYVGNPTANRRRVAAWLRTFPLDEEGAEDAWLLHVENASWGGRDWFVLQDMIHRFDDELFHGKGRFKVVTKLSVAGQSVTLRRGTR
jgi:hypothetical protein